MDILTEIKPDLKDLHTPLHYWCLEQSPDSVKANQPYTMSIDPTKDLVNSLNSIHLSTTTNKANPAEDDPPRFSKLNNRHKVQEPGPIFLKKKFNSLNQRKHSAENTTGQVTPQKINIFNRNTILSDTPIAVDDKRWGENKPFYQTDTLKYTPVKANNVNYKSPFRDVYGKRACEVKEEGTNSEGFGFLDNPDVYKDEKDLAEELLKTSNDNEIELKEPVIVDIAKRHIDGLKATLLDHQIHGIDFLLEREDTKHEQKGGLLCDDMGLGKTIQIIALILKNRPTDLSNLDDITMKDLKVYNARVPRRKFKASLVICPVSLTTQWASEIKKFAPSLKTLIFHGPYRPTDYRDLLQYDVVVTSYETIRSEFDKVLSPIYRGYWHRVILDEAHSIKNKKAKSAIAAFNIESLRRWCLTGTPVQNSIEELQSLFYFTRCSNLSDEEVWKKSITRLINTGESKKAFLLLRKDLSALMLRRTKAILNETKLSLPPKNIHKCEIEFSDRELQLYRDLESFFIKDLRDDFDGLRPANSKEKKVKPLYGDLFSQVSKEKLVSQSSDNFYMRALVYLLRLRQLCCHWKLLTDLDEENLEELNNIAVNIPNAIVKKEEEANMDSLSDFMNKLSVKERRCENCLTKTLEDGEKICGSCNFKLSEEVKSKGVNDVESSKVLKLLEILEANQNRKTIVFSQFRQLFILLGPTLQKHGIKFAIYDGSMTIKQKDESLQKLKEDSEITVLLCSLKSGAVGLNLTFASQVIMFDPWWNPQLQNQAIDRVYRIGQTRSVDVYEFAVKNSVEMRILKLQEKKRMLAKAITDNDVAARDKLNSLTQREIIKLFGIGR